ncbi:hypothetical protein GCM10023116_35640 [Kistimonas scapharcae]|uniref:Uncharacterized protein n=1 Tax=Kistimonas scapharcae TaxID=1036133 RepID=A0ABP8V7Q7_9GAMM
MEFSVCVTGKLRSGFKAKTVQKDFSALFNLSDKKVLKNIFSATAPVLIRKGLSLPEAEQYRQKLHDIGMEAMIIDEEGQPLQRVAGAAAGGASSASNTDGGDESSVVFYEDDGDEDASGPLALDSCSVTAPFSWISNGFGLFKSAPLFWVGFTFLFGIISFMLNFFPLVGFILSSIFSGITYAFMALGAHRVSHNETLSFSDVMDDLKPNLLPVGILNILYGVIATGITFGAFAIAGDNYMLGVGIVIVAMIAIAFAFLFAPMLIAVNHLSIPEALKMSFMGCIKNILPLILYLILSIVLFILGMLPLGLGLLVVMPLLVLATYQAYSEIVVNQ